jgi:hypothetical protein
MTREFDFFNGKWVEAGVGMQPRGKKVEKNPAAEGALSLTASDERRRELAEKYNREMREEKNKKKKKGEERVVLKAKDPYAGLSSSRRSLFPNCRQPRENPQELEKNFDKAFQ